MRNYLIGGGVISLAAIFSTITWLAIVEENMAAIIILTAIGVLLLVGFGMYSTVFINTMQHTRQTEFFMTNAAQDSALLAQVQTDNARVVQQQSKALAALHANTLALQAPTPDQDMPAASEFLPGEVTDPVMIFDHAAFAEDD